MTSIFSSISGYFSKSLILGTFLPVVIFVIISWLFVVPMLPGDWPFLQPLEGLEKEWKLALITFVTIVLSGLLYNLNIPLLRLYEGYPWKDSWLGRRRTNHYIAQFNTLQTKLEGTRTLLRAMGKAQKEFAQNEQLLKVILKEWKSMNPSSHASGFKERPWLQVWQGVAAPPASDTQQEWDALREQVHAEFSRCRERTKRGFPDRRLLILPTLLGNVIRSFEYYPTREYKMDAIELWPRLIAVINKDYAAAVDDVKTSFDFMMNSSALSTALSMLMLSVGLLSPKSIAGTQLLASWLGLITVFIFLAYCFYLLSIPRATAWGGLVKGAFDLYRGELLTRLGYQQVLETRDAERKVWGEISRQMIFGDPFEGSLLDYKDKPSPPSPDCVVSGTPPEAALEITRGIRLHESDDVIIIFIGVKNTSQNQAVQNLIVIDRLPAHLDYEWDSAHAENYLVTVTGVNPYRFDIDGILGPNQQLVLTYRAVHRKTSHRHSLKRLRS
jgi:uncharacterized repeat protein (TIGR01451 family)